MRTAIHIFIVITWTCIAQAQPTFEKLYLATGAYKRDLIELPSGNILIPIAWYPGITILDPAGDFLHSKCFFGDSVLTMQSIRRVADNDYLFLSSYRKDSCSTIGNTTVRFTHPAVGRMDSLGNITSFKHYRIAESPCLTRAGDFKVTSDSGAIIWGRDNHFYALRLDATLAPLWSRRFAEQGGFHFIKELPNGDFLAGINLRLGGATVARLDPDGNLIWCKSYIRPNGVVHDTYIESDGSFIVTGYTDSTTTSILEPLSASFQPKLFMMKLDGDGEVQWCRGFDSAPYYWHTPRWSRIIRATDGNFVVAATMGTPGYNLAFRPLLMKLNDSGDTLWTRSTGRIGYLHEISDLLEYSDGGYMISGSIYGSLPGNWSGGQFIFKADSLGRFPCWEWQPPIVLVDLFPTDSSVTLTPIAGVTMHEAFANDTTFAPIATYDGCTFTANLPPDLSRSRARPSIRPNPNTGRFTVVFADPLMAESYYSVYDAMGKLLFQRPLPQGKETEEVDLSRFGRGTYVLRVTNREGSCYERVVVE
jgi:hypothetical protein